MFSQLEICLGCVLKALVAVELQLCGDLLLFSAYCLSDGVQHQVHRLLCCSFVGHNTVVIQISDHGQVQHTLFGVDVRDVRYPFAVWCFGVKVSVEKILVFVYLLAHLLPLSVAANLCQQAVFLHDTQDGFGVVINPFAVFQPLPHPSVTVSVKAFALLLSDRFGKSSILFWPVYPLYKAVIAASRY